MDVNRVDEYFRANAADFPNYKQVLDDRLISLVNSLLNGFDISITED